MKARDIAEATDTISPSQICIGLHVHLDLSWTEHPFPFSSFKIKNQEQVEMIRGLGLQRVRYSPSRSDCKPTDATAAPAAEPCPAAPVRPLVLAEKRGQQARLQAYRERVSACERELAAHARIAQSMQRNIVARPDAVRQNAASLVGSMAGSMLLDADLTIHLMSDKVGGERVHVHSLNVTVLALMLARELKLPGEALLSVGMGAIFHDLGHAELPARLAGHVRERDSHDELAYQRHCQLGVEVATRLGLAADVIQVVAQHHERADGRGFPKRLKSAQVSRAAQMVAIADQFDALCNPHHVAQAMTPHEALSLMYGQQRSHYEMTALMTFVRCVGVYPPGTLVSLSNGTLAMVLSVNSSRPLKPTVVIHDPGVSRADAIVVDLEREPDVAITRALRPEQLSSEQRAYLSPRQRTAYYFSSDAKTDKA